jgi:hypothetical protein
MFSASSRTPSPPSSSSSLVARLFPLVLVVYSIRYLPSHTVITVSSSASVDILPLTGHWLLGLRHLRTGRQPFFLLLNARPPLRGPARADAHSRTHDPHGAPCVARAAPAVWAGRPQSAAARGNGTRDVRVWWVLVREGCAQGGEEEVYEDGYGEEA